MKIVILGYGKMGQLIEKFALKRGHEIALIVDAHNRETLTAEDLADADIAIDFSTPDAALENISLCFEADLPFGNLSCHKESSNRSSILYRSSSWYFCLYRGRN